MFVSRSRALRGQALAPPLPALALLFVIPLFASLLAGSLSLAVPAPASIALSAADAERAGLALGIVSHTDLPVPVVELIDQEGAPRRSLLAVAPNGDAAALAEPAGPDPSTLVLVAADGGQLRIPMPGLIAGAFAPDGAWLAATDGVGRLWQIGSQAGTPRILADGPFAGPLAVDDSGAVLALSVPSVEAPWYAHAVRVTLDAAPEPLSGEDLVYGVQPLADGSLAVVAHRPGSTVVQHLLPGGHGAVAELDLGPGAVNVSSSGNFELVAFERDGRVLLARAGQVRDIGPGRYPRLSSDGSLLLVEGDGETVAYGGDGSVLARLSPIAGFAGCGGCAS